MINEEVGSHSPHPEDGGCPKNSAPRAVTQNIKVSTAGPPRAGPGPAVRWLNWFLFAGFIPKGDVWFLLPELGLWGAGAGEEIRPPEVAADLGEMPVSVPAIFLVENSPDSLSLLLLKVGSKLMEAPGSVASGTWSFTAGKMQPGQPPGRSPPWLPGAASHRARLWQPTSSPNSQGPRGGESYSNSITHSC